MFDWIAFDADDTLWKNEEYYLQGRDLFCKILEKYDIEDPDTRLVDELEVKNIQYYGYGAMSFVLSLIELVIKLTDNRIRAQDIQSLLNHGKEILSEDVEVFPGVQPLLETLFSKYKLMMITKGDLFHQQRKLSGSGLSRYFQNIEVVSEKNPKTYQEILDRLDVVPENFLMIGNSLRSDIFPILDLGARAIHLTEHLTWSHEDDLKKELPGNRFIAVERIDQVLSAIELFYGQEGVS